MDVLNTLSGGINAGALILAILFGLFAVLLVLAGRFDVELSGLVLYGILYAVIAVLCAFHVYEPVRREVTLRPGYVIDATKYEVVEQRGQIYVIEERKEARK